jgi:hypothetical protein
VLPHTKRVARKRELTPQGTPVAVAQSSTNKVNVSLWLVGNQMIPVFVTHDGRVLDFDKPKTQKTSTPEGLFPSLFVGNTVVPEVEVKKEEHLPLHIVAEREAAKQSSPKRK